MTGARTHLVGSAFILAMMLSLFVATVTAILSTPALVRHAGEPCAAPITIAMLTVPFKGTYGP